MKKVFLYSLLLFIFLLSAEKSFGQSGQAASKAQTETTEANAKSQPFIYRIESGNPNVKLLIALSPEDIARIENNIMEYEKRNNIADRTHKIYILNPDFEITSVTEPEK